MKINIQDIHNDKPSEEQKLIDNNSKKKIQIINDDSHKNNYQLQSINSISINKNGLNEKIKVNNNNGLSEEEVKKAKENSFILLGKTGVGKTSLLNVIYGKEAGKVGLELKAETDKSCCYYIKENIDNKYIYFCIIDTPGLFDTRGRETDQQHKKELMKLISDENLKIKGLLFLSNFQLERFDASEQYTMIDYNKIFPLKDFWNRMIFIFTHYYGDPNGETKEEMRNSYNTTRYKLLKNLMMRVEKVSNPVQLKDLNFKYINIYTTKLNEQKIKNNLEIRKEIITEIMKYIYLKPMFSKLQIFTFENYQLEKNDSFLYNGDLYIYLDSNDKIITQDFHINRISKYLAQNKEQKVQLNIEDCEMDEKGNLFKRTTKKEGFEQIFKNYKGEIGGGLTALSLIGMVCSCFFFPTLPVSLASIASLVTGGYLWKQNRNEKEEDKKRTEEIMKRENIFELIKNEMKKFDK